MTAFRKKTGLAIAHFSAAGIGFWCGAAAGQTIAPAPITQEQVESGQQLYTMSCAGCHGEDLSGNGAPALAGAPFHAAWATHTTAELYTYMRATMPYCVGGALGDQAYADIVAFVLKQNGAKPGSEILTPVTNIKIGDILPPPG